MDSANLEKINPKFVDERKCKNERCGAFFLDKEPQDYCPFCRERGIIGEENKDVLYKETDTTKLAEEVKLLKKSPKKEFKPKKCSMCGKKFTPASPNQQICSVCRATLTS
jgi:methionyl-tRNA synthetase